MKNSWLLKVVFVGAIFLPRLILADDFFIQDEQPWIDRSQAYVDSLFAGDFAGAVRYPLSNHPAITLMTTVGPVMNFYGAYHDLSGTYEGWSTDHKREAAVWARYVWGIVCSCALIILGIVVSKIKFFHDRQWAAGLTVVLLGLEPWVWGISRSVSVDVLMAIGVVGMLCSAIVAYEQKSAKWAIYSGAWFAIAFISKSPALITAPLAIVLASYIPRGTIKDQSMRLLLWFFGAFITACIVWPPFVLHPVARLTDVLARAELHSTVQEIYNWPGAHPPLFIFTLSAFATVGCILYILNRIRDIRAQGWKIFAPDILFIAGIWHGALLLYLNGDHARKNLPVLALLAFVGAFGWIWSIGHRKVSKITIAVGLLVLQGIFVWPYFPHVITSYNVLFPSSDGKRLLVDVGNGSRLIANYINDHAEGSVYAIPMDSLVAPYLDGNKRDSIRGFPPEGKLANIDKDVTDIIIPASLPARISFDVEGKNLLEEVSRKNPKAILSIRDVPMFLIYSIDDEDRI
jgi:hypothetical protein